MIDNSGTHPKSLLEISGARIEPASCDNSVLVILDPQNEYVSGKLPLKGIEAAIVEVSRLLAAARAAGTPVIHIVHHAAPGRPVFARGSHGAQIISELTPLPTEEVIEKTLPSALARTTLSARLEHFADQGRKSIILAGFATHMCVSTTARAALDLGIPATVVAAATATRDLPNPQGGFVPAEMVQASALAEIADRFAAVVPNTASLG